MRNNLRFIIVCLFILLSTAGLNGQQFEKEINLNWKGIVSEQVSGNLTVQYLYFMDAVVDPSTSLPSYTASFDLDLLPKDFDCKLMETVYIPVDVEEKSFLEKLGFSSNNVIVHHEIYSNKKKPILAIHFIPIRYNPETGVLEKLISATLQIHGEGHAERYAGTASRTYADHSVLSSGEWYKVKVSESGIYKITYDDLLSYGMDPGTINPSHIRIYGNAGGFLPERNSTFRHDDLQENAIMIHGEEDGSFDPDDYVLFYGMSPHIWEEQIGFFLQQLHHYDDYNYYYITTSLGEGKRIETEPQASGSITATRYSYNDYQIVEDETHNLIESGKTWYGDEFGEINSRTYSFHFPHIVPEETVGIKTSVANRTFINDLLIIKVNDTYADSVTMTSIDVNSTKFAQKKKKTNYYTNLGSDIVVELEYQPAEPISRMWLDFINVNVISSLVLDEDQLAFRDLSSVSDEAITEFVIDYTDENTSIWDVTNPIQPREMASTFNNNQTSIVVSSDSLREFIAFKGTNYYSPEFSGIVANQDLHGSGPYDMVIVVHPDFLDQAEQLAQLHSELDDFSILTVTPSIIYNEFSSGKQDPTAIRDLLKLYYDKYEGQEPRFLLLFGDGSFDMKERIEHNTNYIPTFQTRQSLVNATSYVVDDYFGLLDDDEGDDATGYLDVGIGRLPVQTPQEAQEMVDKIKRYLVPEEPQFGKWRTRVCMIADDEDSNMHLEQADSLTSAYFLSPLYNQNKIYLDAYSQEESPSGDRYPEVTEAITNQVHDGALIINYIGHGGTGGWAHERILQQNDMINWENKYKLPMFITATCEFSRFDEPEIVSGGELVLLNPNGGGIALFTTTRLAYSQSNFRLNQRLYARAFTPVDGEMPYLGDLIRESKPPGQETTRNFVLLGDPAIKLSYPKHNVKTTSINGSDPALVQDTIKALQEITIEGQIENLDGNLVEDFNGFVYPVFYDKKTLYKTIGNDAGSYPVEFYNQDKVIWEGKASVVNGKFSFQFTIPLDIAYNFGSAKISYYAFSETEDATGYCNDLILGGIDEHAEPDNKGPEIRLFINDTTFVSGDLTHENPTMLAFISDDHGINQSENGIGHSITLTMNEDYSNIMIMDPYFVVSTDNYRQGSLEFPFQDLPDGKHSLTLKAWDSYNNSSTETVEFVIDRYGELNVYEVINYPNPFVEKTTFSFKHTRPGDELDIELTLFDLTGRYLLSYATKVSSSETEIAFLTWNGRDVNGARLPQGIYLYTVKVTDEIGQETIIRQKLVLGF